MTDFPLTAPDEDQVTSPDYDHVQEAKSTLDHIEKSVRTLDITQAVSVAQVHALVSIAQSLEALAFAAEADDFGLGMFLEPLPSLADARTASAVPDYYREG
jgi:hypothetical protein